MRTKTVDNGTASLANDAVGSRAAVGERTAATREYSAGRVARGRIPPARQIFSNGRMYSET
ncbi:hypothetical protein G3A49_08575 [Haloferax volcanii]|uniref:Uncharacterized protein n=3 Tax=Haloferax volcanii TaxID=2246 RepID=A0A6C0V046_HALVO|nr:hypothetical protein D320_00768 [Haloferax sp. BAB-2207]ELZ73409.1 hypothetical protein C456_11589 [Haloferax lucentense DSM 14919]ELZ92070.1 hypothetical protein C452_05598 [Haloferax alexandrinus JCM 10717]MBC9985842.1 hypothetical protein [Haloferax sp. AS1]NLV01994.1 hypothetical protein [Haloferax alexandrinus]RDZ32785.1 hypothetical protein DEQ67_03165 [Haloferax sp. Atlit-48N]RDZ37529.1 hypothetical protein C5B88_05395 [Haloferax sp. Atlit-24N]RDZ40972.1 hypothetical protein C5B89_